MEFIIQPAVFYRGTSATQWLETTCATSDQHPIEQPFAVCDLFQTWRPVSHRLYFPATLFGQDLRPFSTSHASPPCRVFSSSIRLYRSSFASEISISTTISETVRQRTVSQAADSAMFHGQTRAPGTDCRSSWCVCTAARWLGENV